MGKPSAPTPPDPAKTAAAQTSSNIDTAIANGYLNATNQNTPYGTVRYNQTGGQYVGNNFVPTFESTTSLNPQYQKILDSQAGIGQQALDTGSALLKNVQGTNSSPFSLSGLPSTVSNVNSDLDRQKYEDAFMQRFNQDWDRQSAANDAKLANQGIARGSEAYTADKDIENRARNDAMAQAILNSGQEQSRLFGLDLQNANLQNQARQQGIAEQQLVRNQPLNELSALLGFSPGINTPNAPNFGGNVAGTDIAGITQNNFANQMANYQTKIGQQNAMMGGLFGLGSAAILASDIRLKKDIRRIGKTDSGLPIYTYRYKSGGGIQVGVMAQDVEKVMPWAVHEVGGYKAVDYSMVQ
jgi:hypothetical protein